MTHEINAPSEARRRLDTLIAARDETLAAMARAQAALGKLTAAQRLPDPIAGALARLDATETATMAQWSKGEGADEAPAPDSAQRDSLNRRLTDARARAEAARRAEAGLTGEYAREAGRLPRIQHEINVSAAEILAEEAETFIADFCEANAALSAKAGRLHAFRDSIMSLAEAAPPGESARAIYATLAGFNSTLAATLPRPADDHALARENRAEIRAFVGRLTRYRRRRDLGGGTMTDVYFGVKGHVPSAAYLAEIAALSKRQRDDSIEEALSGIGALNERLGELERRLAKIDAHAGGVCQMRILQPFLGVLGDSGSDAPLIKVSAPASTRKLNLAHAAAAKQVDALKDGPEKAALRAKLDALAVAIRAHEIALLSGKGATARPTPAKATPRPPAKPTPKTPAKRK